MKKIKYLLVAIVVFCFGILNVNASGTLTIGDCGYDETTGILTVTGTSSYSEVMVSIFDGDQLLTFKTVSTDHNNYMTTFNILFDSDKTVKIKVGDINSENYKIKNLSVKESNIIPTRKTVVEDDQNNKMTILDSTTSFDEDDNLLVEYITDFDNLDPEQQFVYDSLVDLFGTKKRLVAVMKVDVVNGQNSHEMPETNKKYKLFLSFPQDQFSALTKPYAARIIDFDHVALEKANKMVYDTDDGGVTLYVNNVGLYALYEDLGVEYKQTNNKDYAEYYKKDGKELTLTINADNSKFLNIYMDDVLVDNSNYTRKAGSTVITFKKEYMQSLSTGTHTIVVDYTDGESVIALSVIDAKNPNTGDYISYYIFLGLVSLVGLISGVLLLRKRKTN